MPICRFFLKGTCRFGDRCYYDHVESNSDSYGNISGRNKERYGQHGQTNNYQQSNQNKYESRKYFGQYPEGYRTESPSRYSENYRPESPPRYYDNYRTESPSRYYENYRTESPSRYSYNYRTESPSGYSQGTYLGEWAYGDDRYSDSYKNEAPRYSSGTYSNERYGSGNYNENQRNYSTKNQYAPPSTHYQKKGQRDYYSQQEAVEGVNSYGQNKYKWKADELKKQARPRSYKDEDYSTSTPKGEKNSFSFKLPESEIKKKSVSQPVLTEQDQMCAEIVKSDGIFWEHGGLWPFTCYFPIPGKSGFPGFSDLSPEELRYAAYKAEENSAFQSYVQAVQNILAQINQQRSQLQVPTPELLETLRRIWKGEDLCSNSANLVGSIPFLQCEASGTGVMPNAFPGNNAAASFSFKMTTETDSSSKSSAAAFSFKLPGETKASTVSGGDAEIYTPLENLTEEEKEQFSASTFVLGKIPTKPPPQLLCA